MNKPFDMYSWRRKYMYLAENDAQHPDYDPAKHKTLLKGAIDLKLEAGNVVMHLPFEEESEFAVAYVVPVSEVEKNVGMSIESQEDLDKAYDEIYSWLHNSYTGPFASKTTESISLEEKASNGVYFVKVDLRDAQRAHAIVDDMYRNAGLMIRGNEFFSADPGIIQDLIMDFGTHDIEIEDDNLDFSDYDGHSDNDTDMMDLYEKYIKGK